VSLAPVICFGQQPCGFFPKRFLVAKIQTARRLQSEIGGEIIFFCHDSDHDPRETQTVLRHRKTNEPAILNFAFANKVQRKFSPLFLKRIPPDWHPKTVLQLPNYVEHPLIDLFKSVSAATVADFCLEMYRRMGLLEGIRVMRSSDSDLRCAACDIAEFFVDVPYEGEIVRARAGVGVQSRAVRDYSGDTLKRELQLTLHEGGNSFITLPLINFTKAQISPARDTRLCWMQSVLHCTHYVAGAGEQAYLRREDAPEITFIQRDTIDRSDEAYTEIKN
jgi:hypothetical protein